MYCPPLKGYAPAIQSRLAGELPSLPSEARTMINDYGLLRRECRAIKS